MKKKATPPPLPQRVPPLSQRIDIKAKLLEFLNDEEQPKEMRLLGVLLMHYINQTVSTTFEDAGNRLEALREEIDERLSMDFSDHVKPVTQNENSDQLEAFRQWVERWVNSELASIRKLIQDEVDGIREEIDQELWDIGAFPDND